MSASKLLLQTDTTNKLKDTTSDNIYILMVITGFDRYSYNSLINCYYSLWYIVIINSRRLVLFIALFLIYMGVWLPQSASASGYSSSSPQPVARMYSTTRQLPKTGPPLIGFALIGLLPVGLKLRNYGRNVKLSDL